jgi:hypothetical protein
MPPIRPIAASHQMCQITAKPPIAAQAARMNPRGEFSGTQMSS